MNVSKLNERRLEGTPGFLLSSLYQSGHTIPDLVVLMLEISHKVGNAFGLMVIQGVSQDNGYQSSS